MNPTRRRFLTGLSVLAVAPIVAACGSDDPGTATDTPAIGGSPATGGPEADAFPVTLDHKFGSTEISAAPQRVVAVGLVEQDALLALGVVPVGVTYWFGDKALQGIYPWAEDALGDGERPTLLENTNGIEVEKIAALAPDLIIGQYAGITQDEYDLLSKIAPTVAQSADVVDYGMSWEDSTLTIGAALGRPAAAQALVDDVTAQVRAAADPAFAGQSAVCVTSYEGLFVYGPEDPRGRLLADLGFTFPEKLVDPDVAEFGWSLSAERVGDLADVGSVTWFDYASAEQGMKDIFQATPAFTEGRLVDVGEDAGAYYVAQSFVTPLSIPYLLERLLPQLKAAADGDPATRVPVVTA